MLTRRLQVLVDPRQYQRLERHARAQGLSVGEVVRDAIDRVAGPDTRRRMAALERVLGAPPVELPADPAVLEAEIDSMLEL